MSGGIVELICSLRRKPLPIIILIVILAILIYGE